jgi:hypothetical protein
MLMDEAYAMIERRKADYERNVWQKGQRMML